MTEYNSYPTLLQSSQAEYVSSETMDGNTNQISNNSNNNIIYNSAPLIVLNSQKSDMALLQNSMMNDGQTYVTIQTQPNTGATDLNGAKMLNTPIIIQSSQMPLQSSQYQQQPPTTLNVQQNTTQMTSLTPSQLQSLSYLMQTQIAPQFIQTANGFIQIIPQSFLTTQNQGQGHDNSLHTQITGLPTLGWSLGNFNGNSNTLDNQLQPLQLNSIALPQLIPMQHVLQNNNSFFTNSNDDQDQMVSTIVDLNCNDKKSTTANGSNRKPSRRKRKGQTNKTSVMSGVGVTTVGGPESTHPTSTNEVAREAAESSSGGRPMPGGDGGMTMANSITHFDNKGRPFAFLCPDCPKRFTLNSRLSAHMRCHTGMRPFTCAVCGFSFTQKSYLIRHAAVHKEERPFHCERCQKSYKHYGSLANHRKLHRKDEKIDGDQQVQLQLQQVGMVVKTEPSASDNGRSSSISSVAITGCGEGMSAGGGGPSGEDVHSTTAGDDGGYVRQLGLYCSGGAVTLGDPRGGGTDEEVLFLEAGMHLQQQGQSMGQVVEEEGMVDLSLGLP